MTEQIQEVGWWLLWSVLIGAGLSAWLYGRSKLWSMGQAWLLGFLRAGSIGMLVFLLLHRSCEQEVTKKEPLAFAIAWDNSLSMIKGGDSVQLRRDLALLHRRLKEWGSSRSLDLFWYNLARLVSSDMPLRDDYYEIIPSNVSQMLQHIVSAQGGALDGIILISDGIHYGGIAPEYLSLDVPVWSLGVGDTTQRKDIRIRHLLYNKVAYWRTRSVLEVGIAQEGFAGRRIAVRMEEKKGGKRYLRATQEVLLEKEGLTKVRFPLEAERVGVQEYIISVSPLGGEQNIQNNRAEALVEVVKDQMRVLLHAFSPHPDVGALHAVLGASKYYDVELVIRSLGQTPQAKTPYDVVVWYDAFAQGTSKAWYDALLGHRAAPASWWFFTPRSQLSIAERSQPYGSGLKEGSTKGLQVLPTWNKGISLFLDPLSSHVESFSPIRMGNIGLRQTEWMDVLLYQRIGQSDTKEPLWSWREIASQRSAFTLGEGYWQWQIREKNTHQDALLFKKLVHQTLQYLSVAQKRQRFDVYPTQYLFTAYEPLRFRTEWYDAVFQPVEEQYITMTIWQDSVRRLQTRYLYHSSQPLWQTKNLGEGTYRYEARGEGQLSRGVFQIRQNPIELQQLTAQHSRLEVLSENSQGKFFSRTEDLLRFLENNPWTPTTRTYTQTHPALMPFLLVVILLFSGLEWGLRKYFGHI